MNERSVEKVNETITTRLLLVELPVFVWHLSPTIVCESSVTKVTLLVAHIFPSHSVVLSTLADSPAPNATRSVTADRSKLQFHRLSFVKRTPPKKLYIQMTDNYLEDSMFALNKRISSCHLPAQTDCFDPASNEWTNYSWIKQVQIELLLLFSAIVNSLEWMQAADLIFMNVPID